MKIKCSQKSKTWNRIKLDQIWVKNYQVQNKMMFKPWWQNWQNNHQGNHLCRASFRFISLYVYKKRKDLFCFFRFTKTQFWLMFWGSWFHIFGPKTSAFIIVIGRFVWFDQDNIWLYSCINLGSEYVFHKIIYDIIYSFDSFKCKCS